MRKRIKKVNAPSKKKDIMNAVDTQETARPELNDLRMLEYRDRRKVLGYTTILASLLWILLLFAIGAYLGNQWILEKNSQGLARYFYEDFMIQSPTFTILIVIGALGLYIIYFSLNLFSLLRKQRRLEIKNQLDKDTIVEKDSIDIYTDSLKLSYKYLDEYYAQTRLQAEKGFRVTVMISSFGALLIGAR